MAKPDAGEYLRTFDAHQEAIAALSAQRTRQGLAEAQLSAVIAKTWSPTDPIGGTTLCSLWRNFCDENAKTYQLEHWVKSAEAQHESIAVQSRASGFKVEYAMWLAGGFFLGHLLWWPLDHFLSIFFGD